MQTTEEVQFVSIISAFWIMIILMFLYVCVRRWFQRSASSNVITINTERAFVVDNEEEISLAMTSHMITSNSNRILNTTMTDVSQP